MRCGSGRLASLLLVASSVLVPVGCRPHTGDLGEQCNSNLHNTWCNGGLVCENDLCVAGRPAADSPICQTRVGSHCGEGQTELVCTGGATPTSGSSPPEPASSSCSSVATTDAGVIHCCTRHATCTAVTSPLGPPCEAPAIGYNCSVPATPDATNPALQCVRTFFAQGHSSYCCITPDGG
ncbi:MAG: hypothetical protein KF764_22080 [Labilithrix sp.]|nr:hypothetical protein [Labilithrix sp.]